MSKPKADRRAIEQVVNVVWKEVESAMNEVDMVLRTGGTSQGDGTFQNSFFGVPPHPGQDTASVFIQDDVNFDRHGAREIEMTDVADGMGNPMASNRDGTGKLLGIRHSRSTMQWYTLVYNAVTMYFEAGQGLYFRLEAYLDQYMRRAMRNFKRTSEQFQSSNPSYDWIVDEFSCIFGLMRFTALVFGYLDKFVAKRMKLPKVREMFIRGFHSGIYEQVKVDMASHIITEINRFRKGEVIDTHRVKNAMEIFNRVGISVCTSEEEAARVYNQDFLKAFMAEMRWYYTSESRARQAEVHIGRLSARGFMEWASAQFTTEKYVADNFLRAGAFENEGVRQELVDCLIKNPAQFVRDTHLGLKVLLEDERMDDIKKLYNLCGTHSDNSGLLAMRNIFLDYVVECGKQLYADFESSDPSVLLTNVEKTLMEGMINLEEKAAKLIKDAFENKKEFKDQMEKAWPMILETKLQRTQATHGKHNVHRTDSAEVLASYVDSVLKDEYKDLQTIALEEKRLRFLAMLASHLKEKDIFEEHARDHMAKRLLGSHCNEELERLFMSRLQQAIDLNITHKMEGMLVDVEKSDGMSKEFADSKYGGKVEADFNVKILSASRWPPYKTDRLTPPPDLAHAMDHFTKFYKSSNKSKKLNWVHMVGTSVLKIGFKKGSKEVSCNTTQASIILLLDAAGQLSVKDIAQSLTLESGKIVKPHIATMYLSKQFSFVKKVGGSGSSGVINDDDILALDPGFTHRTRKFKLPLPSSNRSAAPAGGGGGGGGGAPSATADIAAKRKVAIDCAVVRVMKSRRTMGYTELLDTVVQQVSKRFPAEPRMVKQRIEELLGRGYIKRSDADSAVFEYLA